MEKNDASKTKSNEIEAEEMIKLFPPRVKTSAFNFLDNGTLILRDDSPVVLDPQCFRNNGIDLSGGSFTGSNGRMTWRLLNFVCPETVAERGGFPINFPMSFVATPLTDKPCYITVKFIPSTVPNDVVFEVFSWNRNGQPAPKTPFEWRVRIPLTLIIG